MTLVLSTATNRLVRLDRDRAWYGIAQRVRGLIGSSSWCVKDPGRREDGHLPGLMWMLRSTDEQGNKPRHIGLTALSRELRCEFGLECRKYSLNHPIPRC